jgi:hypothetical protein
MPYTKDDVGLINGQVGSEAERQAVADEWNANELLNLKAKARAAFRAEGLARITASTPAFNTFEELELVRAMTLGGMLQAKGTWGVAYQLSADIVVYYTDEALPRINGTGGHPALTVAQLETIIAQVSDALPFAGVDATDTGWPT